MGNFWVWRWMKTTKAISHRSVYQIGSGSWWMNLTWCIIWNRFRLNYQPDYYAALNKPTIKQKVLLNCQLICRRTRYDPTYNYQRNDCF